MRSSPFMLPKLGDVDVHASPVEVVGVPPNVPQRMAALEQGVLVLAQHEEQLVLFGGQALGLALEVEGLAVVVVVYNPTVNSVTSCPSSGNAADLRRMAWMRSTSSSMLNGLLM